MAESLVGRYAKDQHGAYHIISENTEMHVGTLLFLCDPPEQDPIMLLILNEKLTTTQEIREAAAKFGLDIPSLLPEGKARQMYNDYKYAVMKEKALSDQAAKDKIQKETLAKAIKETAPTT